MAVTTKAFQAQRTYKLVPAYLQIKIIFILVKAFQAKTEGNL